MQNTLKKQPDEKLKISDIFKPGTAIDVVFDMDEDVPVVRSSMIHDCDYKKSQMIISQPTPRILPSFQYNTMTVTTIVEKELNEKFRSGVNVAIDEFLTNYALSDHVKENAILVTYETPPKKVNIRSAYRLEPGLGYEIHGTLTFRGETYSSDKLFKVKDISFTGLGIKCPVQVKQKANPLFLADINEDASVEIRLENPDKSSPNVTISSKILIVRKKLTAANKFFFLGMKFSSLAVDYEKILSKYIHEAQISKIKHGSRL
jgi:c-di-GMP-binding flagellar brake protein YcgR